MLESTFSSVFGTAESLVGAVSAADFLLCCVFSVVLGAACAGVYMFRHSYSKNFVVTLALLPLIVQMVITLVNGHLGAGIAVMGVFNLVRFRSIPGSAKDIGSVFLAMAIGLATGMGFLGLAVVFTVVVAVVNLMFVLTQDAAHHHSGRFGIRRCLRRSAQPLRLGVGADRGDDYQHGQPLPADLPAPPARAGA